MQLEVWAANELAGTMAARLAGGHVAVLDAGKAVLARCHFAEPAFDAPEDGAIAAFPFPPAIGLRDGVPDSFDAIAADGRRAFSGSAGYRDDFPRPEMVFRTRQILEGADVLVESFVFSMVLDDGAET